MMEYQNSNKDKNDEKFKMKLRINSCINIYDLIFLVTFQKTKIQL
jgi:hypothetical protein